MDRFITHSWQDPLISTVSLSTNLTSDQREKFQNAVKETVQILISLNPPSNSTSGYADVYIGHAGIALMLERCKSVVQLPGEMDLPWLYCQSALKKLEPSKHFSFLCTEIGVYCVAASVDARRGDEKEARMYARNVIEAGTSLIPRTKPEYELLYGLTGYLYSLFYLDRQISFGLDAKLVKSILERIVEGGREGAKECDTPGLMWKWHDKAYLGAAHGTAGTLTMLMGAKKYLNGKDLDAVKTTVDYLITLQAETGNFPSSLGAKDKDRLVQWCHGAPGFILMLCEAFHCFGDSKYLDVAEKAGEVVWNRGLLKKGVGLCHGICGNAYSFLELYKATRKAGYYQRAVQFAEYALDWRRLTEDKTFTVPDRPWSLFEGIAGAAMLWIDLLANRTGFPCMTDVFQ